jgi:cysteine sulfinate desulfinase/cysteine desulfurase-like protein
MAAGASLRFSFDRFNSDADIEHVLGLAPQVIDKLRRPFSPATSAWLHSMTFSRSHHCVLARRHTRLPNTSSLSFGGTDSNAALLLLDRHGVCCSAGSACRTGSAEASHVLRAMYSDEERARGSLRHRAASPAASRAIGAIGGRSEVQAGNTSMSPLMMLPASPLLA